MARRNVLLPDIFRSADDKKPHVVPKLDIVPYTGNFVKERMTESFGFQRASVFQE